MHGRAQLVLQAFIQMLPALMFAVVFIGGSYTLLALVERSWWKPLIVTVAAPLFARCVTGLHRRRRPRPAHDAPATDIARGRRSSNEERKSLARAPRPTSNGGAGHTNDVADPLSPTEV